MTNTSVKRKQELKLALGLVLPALIIMAAVNLYPLIYSFVISLRDYDFHGDKSYPFCGLENYIYIFEDVRFWRSLGITLIFTAGAVTLEIGLALMCALALNRKFRGQGALRVIALLPWAIPPVVNGILWKWILNPRYGALNGLLMQLGVIDEYIVWLGSPSLAMLMVILTDVWKETPFIMLLLLAALQSVPSYLYDAAKIDGAGAFRTFKEVTLALIRPALFVALSLRTIWALKSFDLIYALTQGGPSNSTEVLGYYTYQKSFVSLHMGRGAAAAYIMTFIVLLIVIFYQKAVYQDVEY
ncbi:MAG: sugar ABC transporter permease [Spirochaetales bacterium]|nr:sugar ABC transporter permease [Spirochaetales bacterium]